MIGWPCALGEAMYHGPEKKREEGRSQGPTVPSEGTPCDLNTSHQAPPLKEPSASQ